MARRKTTIDSSESFTLGKRDLKMAAKLLNCKRKLSANLPASSNKGENCVNFVFNGIALPDCLVTRENEVLLEIMNSTLKQKRSISANERQDVVFKTMIRQMRKYYQWIIGHSDDSPHLPPEDTPEAEMVLLDIE